MPKPLSERELIKLDTCKCCGKAKRDVKVRNRLVDRTGRTGPLLCEACWMDTHNKMAECLHGASE